jgi:esterase
MLRIVQYGAEGPTVAPTLLIAHGLFGSARNWGAVAKRLSAGRDVVVADMRNHGESPHLAEHGYADLAADLAEVIGGLRGPVDVLGHSMGGKAAMMLALTRPRLVRRLVVADIAPVAYGHDNTQHITAMRGLDLRGLTTRGEADRRLAVAVPDAALRAFFLQSLDLKAGPPRWRLNFAALEAAMPQIVGWPDVTGVFPGPALFLSGALSPYVLPEHRDRIKALFPKAHFARLANAGHWLHADQPRAFEGAVTVFLDSPGQDGRSA